MKDKSKLTALILSVLAIVVVVISNLFDKDDGIENIENTMIVTNASNFYTVNSCLYRTVTYLSEQDSDSLLLLLNDEYKAKNKITKDNVFEFFEKVDETSTFISEKMYYSNLSESLSKYYVKGHIDKNQIYDDVVFQKKR